MWNIVLKAHLRAFYGDFTHPSWGTSVDLINRLKGYLRAFLRLLACYEDRAAFPLLSLSLKVEHLKVQFTYWVGGRWSSVLRILSFNSRACLRILSSPSPLP